MEIKERWKILKRIMIIGGIVMICGMAWRGYNAHLARKSLAESGGSKRSATSPAYNDLKHGDTGIIDLDTTRWRGFQLTDINLRADWVISVSDGVVWRFRADRQDGKIATLASGEKVLKIPEAGIVFEWDIRVDPNIPKKDLVGTLAYRIVRKDEPLALGLDQLILSKAK